MNRSEGQDASHLEHCSSRHRLFLKNPFLVNRTCKLILMVPEMGQGLTATMMPTHCYFFFSYKVIVSFWKDKRYQLPRLWDRYLHICFYLILLLHIPYIINMNLIFHLILEKSARVCIMNQCFWWCQKPVMCSWSCFVCHIGKWYGQLARRVWLQYLQNVSTVDPCGSTFIGRQRIVFWSAYLFSCMSSSADVRSTLWIGTRLIW